ncbi:MAG: DUF1801 domain-containing protein [Cyclobacteriaceae bacterium]|nr:DUF1801 domain-containing protein [Cyclobacteriaceae bacterium]
MEKILRYTGRDIQNISLEKWLRDHPNELQPIASYWIAEMKNCGPDVDLLFHDGCPHACVEGAPFAYVNVYSTHVNVGFFYGAFIYDADQLLEGTDKRMRHIKIKPTQPANEKAIKLFLKTAYLDIKKRLTSE